jgi:hypothetical protein
MCREFEVPGLLVVAALMVACMWCESAVKTGTLVTGKLTGLRSGTGWPWMPVCEVDMVHTIDTEYYSLVVSTTKGRILTLNCT